MKIRHLDLFSGIGGFALAVDEVWGAENVEHIFCDNNKFCQRILRKHWPDAKIYGDIRGIRFNPNPDSHRCARWDKKINTDKRGEQALNDVKECDRIIADTNNRGQTEQEQQTTGDKQCGRTFTNTESRKSRESPEQKGWQDFSGSGCDILTGGFPCQPFSQAGKRRGTEDDRYLWPEMFRVIRLTKPQWVIAENVRGILTTEGGLVFEQVCSDLEAEGYEVQTFIIPAVAVNAPHRRDRVWFVAHCTSERLERGEQSDLYDEGTVARIKSERNGRECGVREIGADASDTRQQYGKQGNDEGVEANKDKWATRPINNERFSKNEWDEDWLSVAIRACSCGVDDGVSSGLDKFGGYSKARHRVERLKSLGNAIVPAVAAEILRAIRN